MPRPLTTTIALVLVLAVSGCGKDDTSDTTAKSAGTATQASDAAAAGNKAGSSTRGTKKSPGSKTASGPKSSGSKSTGSKSSGSKSSGSKKTSSGSKSSGSKTSAGSKTPAGSNTPATAAGGSPATDASGAADPRLAVVTTVRRYQKDFVDGDGNDACLLLTAAGKKQMNAGGRGRTCAESVKRILDQARDSDIELIKDTRAGIHVDDVKIHGDEATVSIGKGQRLRMARQGGRWLVDDPSP
jgi:hypothetical protein